MEKLFLGTFAAGQKLHVVEYQCIDAPEFVAELIHLVAAQGADELVHEDLGRHEQDLARPIAGAVDMMPDRVDQVGLAQPHSAINKKRVVFFTWLIRDRQRCRMSELIGGPDHKLGEGVTRVELRMSVHMRRVRRRGWGRRRWRGRSTIGRTDLLNGDDGLAQRQLHVDGFSRLGRQRLSQQAEVAFVYPIAEESVGCFYRDSASLNSNEIERSDPGFKSDLAEFITQTVSGSLPQAVHTSPPDDTGSPTTIRLQRVLRSIDRITHKFVHRCG